MKAGEYVRTKYGIKQIYEIDNNKTVWKYKFKLKKQDGDGCVDLGCFSDKDVIKSSPNIIDLIEKFDLVNGHLVICKMYENEKDIPTIVKCVGDYYFKEEDIKSILTKEQFSQMEYRIGD